MYEEVDRVLSGNPPTVADLSNLPYTRMVVSETLRFYPPLWLIFRQALEPDVIGGYQIPAGSRITICPYITHRRQDFWKEPDRFLPERFASDQTAKSRALAYFPFGGGPRQCIGKHLALLAIQLTLVAVVQRYKLHLVPTEEVQPEALLTIRPRNPLRIMLEERRGMEGQKRRK